MPLALSDRALVSDPKPPASDRARAAPRGEAHDPAGPASKRRVDDELAGWQQITLDRLWPTNGVVVQRPADHAVAWLPPAPVWRERSSCAALALAGRIAVLCHRAGATAPGLQLLRDCGLRLPEQVFTYRDAAELRALVATQVLRRNRIGFTYTAEGLLAPRDALVNDLHLLGWLNDKAALADLLPAGATPARRCLSAVEFARAAGELASELPVVIKASSRLGSGGGFDVVICRTADDLAAARCRFASAPRVIVEEWLPFTRTWCAHFAIGDAGVTYLGAAEQVCDAGGLYHGNWCDGSGPGVRAIAYAAHAAEAGWARGYRGFMGADVGETATGRASVFDLNFRNNGSTPQVLLRQAIARRWGAPCTRSVAGVTFAGAYAAMLLRLRAAFDRGELMPVLTFDVAQFGDGTDTTPVCNVLVAGRERAEVRERMRRLRAEGFGFEVESEPAAA